jgi:dTDP-4-amino-4,6-dideoxygalactose transaminase
LKIPYVNLARQYKEEKKSLLDVIDKTLSSGTYVGGKEVKKFENKIAKLCGTKYCLSLNSGTDALTLALFALGVKRGDEVITPSNSFIASTAVIVHLGAKPVFVDVKPDQNINESKIEEKITKKTKIIMPVHLTGRMCDMEKIMKIAKKYKIHVVEDCAQSVFSQYNKIFSGSYGDVGCFSAHPLKNLNALGDSGYLTTNSKLIYKKISELKSHGMKNRNIVERFGYVSRMDNVQAAILNFRLKNLNNVITKRRENVQKYLSYLNPKFYFFPEEKEKEFNTYHTFVLQFKRRNQLKKYLYKNGISTAIHYPLPIHLQPAAKFLNYKKGDLPITEKQAQSILTLPINQFLKNSEIKFISNMINKFYEK